MKGITAMVASARKLQITTWNIAAINNNPFEYWITYNESPGYEKLMSDVESFLESPGTRDVTVSEVFPDDMFSNLERRMTQDCGWPSVRGYWEDDFRNRKIISGFMKDSLLGSKRLASMPDRITNTINVAGSGSGDNVPVCRPTVINMYDGDLDTIDQWWSAWEAFMFDNTLEIKTKKGLETKAPYQMLQPIKRAKYPDITEEEEKVSLPLQTMCGAIFDAILVHIMNTVSDEWQPLKRDMVENLNKKKVPKTLDILESAIYINSDIITLQEVSAAFIDQAQSRPKLGENFWIIAPADMDAVRDQNSVIFLRKETFPDGSHAEITPLVESSFEKGVKVPIAKGDILAITTTDKDGIPFVVASFHGDTNGLATKPVLDAVMEAMSTDATLAGHKLLFGLDANTYEKAKPKKQQDVLEFGKHYVARGLTSCWGDVPDPKNYTTFNSRTYLQPQLNKACKQSDKRSNGDVNPKDFILFGKGDFTVRSTWKDNTGEKEYLEDTAFPTLTFPSDHGILATVLEPISPDSCGG
mmetsp:Transcript_33231/g.61191  ORF Transcript_33231/g.61191 Transcript_33231/m.61191 type:complete len:527 (+) Transcript_33231:78-1658(+)|eukprot:CAMPEP_0196135778 /NCGR_PEP_ID=MMETSP0910-20130528/4307_1 /TAXON_ID=49265 /ORGANISM="Thalassiosira rotula, Strain GSO102" /LENGTH=526 /DNA_ID=CAMNT_0041395967 /DNA_START=62 /DNA_END=1642 /DNA_ORIENTATION=-